jgi:FlaA1/EpsC-like NDP-sugar epimerase
MRWWLLKSGIYLLAWSAALALAIAWTGARPQHVIVTAALFIAVKIGAMALLGSFRELWSHTSLEDLVALVAGVIASAMALVVILALRPALGSPALALADGAVTLALIAPLRVAPRIYHELVRPRLRSRPRAVVLAGRPERVELELRRIRRQPRDHERVAGLVLDGPTLDGARLHRLRVFGRHELKRLIERGRINEVTLVPPASAPFTGALQELCGAHQVPCRSAASLLALNELLASAEQLLDRPAHAGGDPQVREIVEGKTVLVTGAGGSIGSELSLQLLHLRPARLLLVNRGENALFHAERAVLRANESGCRVESHVLDVRSEAAVQRLFARARPDAVFHAAAHKHVPLMERHPAEAVLNNVGGMRVVADAAHGVGVGRFVFISTDKAVHPTSVMGVTKRLGELYVRAMAGQSRTRFVSVRFGNVLGSNGSVLPIFIEQVQRGGPVTVTHAGMTRYFMSIPEACKLVLRAVAHGQGGELFVLDMGKPMRIVDLAARVIERAGLRPGEDVPIVFSGARPGEKLAEQLMFAGELPRVTAADGVWSVEVEEEPLESFGARLDDLLELARTGDELAVRRRLQELVPEYHTPGPTGDEDPQAPAAMPVAFAEV